MTLDYMELDVYPPGKEYVSDKTLEKIAQTQIEKQGLRGKLSSSVITNKLKAAFKVSAVWNLQKYPVLKIAFMDGNKHQKQFVRETVMTKIAPLTTKLQYDWDAPLNEAYIRISFAIPKQAWSMVGTDALSVPPNQPTMNLGWLDDDIQYDNEYYKGSGQVVLHEFLHALAMVHEHSNPKGKPIQWNKEVVYNDIAASNGWSRAQIDNNMFSKYGDKETCDFYKEQLAAGKVDPALPIPFCSGDITNGSDYDVNSIMHYYFPSRWVAGDVEIPRNKELSVLDKEWLVKYYGEEKPVVEKFQLSKNLFTRLDEIYFWDRMYSDTLGISKFLLIVGVYVLYRIK